MKRLSIFALIMCFVICAALLSGCSSAVVPVSSVKWKDGETLEYTVRRASDYELAYVGIYNAAKVNGEYVYKSAFAQIIPSKAEGVYTSTISKTDFDGKEAWLLKTVLTMTETYARADFGGKDALYDVAKSKAKDGSNFYADGDKLISKTSVTTECVFYSSNSLPAKSTRSVKSVFIGGKDACEINDFTVTATYDYSAKKPVLQTKNAAGLQETQKLKKSTAAKTYDNEQLGFVLRGFSLKTLSTNSSTALNVTDTTAGKVKSVTASVAKTYAFDTKLGGVPKTLDKDGKLVYYQDGDAYTDAYGNVVGVTDRKIAEVRLSVGNSVPVLYYFDAKNETSSTNLQALVKMQDAYIVATITPTSLALIG